MVNMHSKYRLHLLFLWKGKNGGQRVSVDVHYRVLSDIDDGSLDMDAGVSIQQAGDRRSLCYLILPARTKTCERWVVVLENCWP